MQHGLSCGHMHVHEAGASWLQRSSLAPVAVLHGWMRMHTKAARVVYGAVTPADVLYVSTGRTTAHACVCVCVWAMQ